jgi:hypothetical protein
MAFSFFYRLYCSVAVLAALVNVVVHFRARRAVIEAAKDKTAP